MAPQAKMLLVIGVAAGVLGVIVAIIVGVSRAQKKRREAMAAAARAMGLAYLARADKAFVKAWSIVKPLSKGGTASHVVYGTLPSGLELTAFEHQYAVSTGNSVHVVTHAVFACETADWPEVSLKRRGAVSKWFQDLMNRGETDLDEDGEADTGFSRNWVVRAEDAGFAEQLLTAELRAVMDAGEKTPWWWFTGGKMAVLVAGKLDEKTLSAGVGLLESAWAALPPDLREAGADS